MSSYLLAKAIRTRSTTGNTRLLLLILADAASDNGLVGHMTIEDMAARCNAHRRTIARALQDLTKARIVSEEVDGLLIHLDDPLFKVDGVAFAEPPEDRPAQPPADPIVPYSWKTDGISVTLRPENEAEVRELAAIEDSMAKEHAAFLEKSMAAVRKNSHAALVAGDPHDLSLHGPEWCPPTPERAITWGTGPDVPGFPPANTLIGALLRAAGVEPDPLVPLYWMRPGHQDDVRLLEADTGMTAAQIIVTCRDMHLKAGPIRRLTALAPMIAREKRRPR